MTNEKNTSDIEQPSKKKARTRPTKQVGSVVEASRVSSEESKQGRKIHNDKIEEMFVAYQKKQSINYVSKVCGVSTNTASKYINKGDSSRQIRSFRQRLNDRRTAQDRHIATNLAKAEDALLEATIGTLSVVRYALVGFTKKIQKGEDIDIDPHRIPGMLKDLNGIIRYAKGDPDAKVEVEDKYKNWSTDELLTYYHKGILPDHAKNDPNAPCYNN